MDKVAEEKIKWFKEQNFEIQLFPEKTVKKLNTLQELDDFINQEKKFWESYPSFANSFNNSYVSYQDALHTNDTRIDEWKRHFNNSINILKNAQNDCDSGRRWAPFSTTRAAKKMKVLVDQYGTICGEYFLSYLFPSRTKVNPNRAQINGRDQFIGAVEGYMFSEQGEHLRAHVSKNKKAFDELHAELDTYLSKCIKAEGTRKSEFNGLKNKISEWENTSDKTFNSQKASFDSVHEEQIKEQEKLFNSKVEDWRKEVDKLKELYRDKLQLDEPVRHWEKLRNFHSILGTLFAGFTVCVGFGVIYFLYSVLYQWPPNWLEGNTWDLNTVKGTILLLTITSIGIYMIGLGSKFSVSSFHLSRDAQERRQLTYVYLALIQKEAISKEEQQIVLQSLFSRADTGLLRGEHAPTMPGVDVIGKVAK